MNSILHLSNLNLNVSHDAHPLTLHQESEQIGALSVLSRDHARQNCNLQDLARCFMVPTSVASNYNEN